MIGIGPSQVLCGRASFLAGLLLLPDLVVSHHQFLKPEHLCCGEKFIATQRCEWFCEPRSGEMFIEPVNPKDDPKLLLGATYSLSPINGLKG